MLLIMFTLISQMETRRKSCKHSLEQQISNKIVHQNPFVLFTFGMEEDLHQSLLTHQESYSLVPFAKMPKVTHFRFPGLCSVDQVYVYNIGVTPYFKINHFSAKFSYIRVRPT